MQQTTQQEIRPRRFWYLIALLIFLLGPFIGITITSNQIYKIIHSGEAVFIAPNGNVINITQPGDYQLRWLVKASDENVTSITIHEKTSGKIIKAAPQDIQKDNSILINMQIKEPGQYEIQTPSVLSQGALLVRSEAVENMTEKLMRTVALSACIFIFGVFAGLIMAIVVFIRRKRAKDRMVNV